MKKKKKFAGTSSSVALSDLDQTVRFPSLAQALCCFFRGPPQFLRETWIEVEHLAVIQRKCAKCYQNWISRQQLCLMKRREGEAKKKGAVSKEPLSGIFFFNILHVQHMKMKWHHSAPVANRGHIIITLSWITTWQQTCPFFFHQRVILVLIKQFTFR